MQFLAILRTLPTTSPASLAPLVRPEAETVWAMHLHGTLRAVHFIQAPEANHPDGVALMLEVDSQTTANRLISSLPMVAKGLIATEILPLAPFTAYGALFANA